MNTAVRRAMSMLKNGVLVGGGLVIGSLRLASAQQPALASVAFSPSTVPGGTSATATITLTSPARNNGFDVSLALSSGVAHVPSAAITIGSGNTTGTVTVTTSATASTQVVTLTATAHNASINANLIITPPSPRTLTISPAAVNAGTPATATITLNGPAPAGGTLVTLGSNNTAVTSQAIDTVLAGQATTTFAVTTKAVASQTNVTLTASAGGVTQSTTLTVIPSTGLASISLASGAVSGAQDALRLTAAQPAPAGGILVHLSSTGADFFGARNLDTVPAGETVHLHSVGVPVVNSDRAFTITASAGGVDQSVSGTIRAPRIAGITLRDTAVSGTTQSALLELNARAPTSGLPVTVESNNAAVARAGTSAFSTGGFSVSVLLAMNPVAQPTSAALTFGLNGSSLSKTIVVLPPQLEAFSISPSTVRPGGTVTLAATLTGVTAVGGRRIQIGGAGLPPGFPTLPSILVPAGEKGGSVTLQLAAFPLPAQVSVTLTATLDRVAKPASLTITP